MLAASWFVKDQIFGSSFVLKSLQFAIYIYTLNRVKRVLLSTLHYTTSMPSYKKGWDRIVPEPINFHLDKSWASCQSASNNRSSFIMPPWVLQNWTTTNQFHVKAEPCALKTPETTRFESFVARPLFGKGKFRVWERLI